MAKQVAHKKSKRLRTDKEINEMRLNEGEFSPNWQGRVYVLDAKRSLVAEKMGVEEKGEYAIKVR